MRRAVNHRRLLALAIGAWILVIALACLMNCAQVFPSSCQPGQQLRDPGHSIKGTSDCYICLDVAPGARDDGNHYRCRDEMCSECERSPVPLGKPLPDAGVVQRR